LKELFEGMKERIRDKGPSTNLFVFCNRSLKELFEGMKERIRDKGLSSNLFVFCYRRLEKLVERMKEETRDLQQTCLSFVTEGWKNWLKG
jgi:hypothetical protein